MTLADVTNDVANHLRRCALGEAREEHLVLGGVAAALIMFMLAYLVIDFLREFNRSSHMGQSERDRRAAMRCWALLGIVICCVVVKQLHHASQNPVTDELDDMHAKHFAPEQVEGGGGVVEEGAEWVEEHGVYRIKQAKDEGSAQAPTRPSARRRTGTPTGHGQARDKATHTARNLQARGAPRI